MAVVQRFMNPNNGIVVTGHEQLLQDIRQIIREEIASQIKPETNDQVLSKKEAARFMGDSEVTFDRKFKRGEYPMSLMHGESRCKKFIKSELEAYLKRS